MMCVPSEADLAQCVLRGVAAARQAGERLPENLAAWAQQEILAAWPHIEAGEASAAVARYLDR
ncbi:MAG: hypothetical protein HQ502_10560 [Alphaproteobacteria bacterium]|nr:hypothetical protein [Alphaproteobacteria bacterium]